jgi:predicted DCC family thiol-disulfide oxidoreductase YuxK
VADRLELGGRLLVVFDGRCGLCNRTVGWFLVRDSLDRMRFAPSESPRIAELLTRHGLGASSPGTGPDTILVILNAGADNETILIRSDAVLALLRELPLPWPAVAAMVGGIPRPLRDLGYRLIARWRYRIWGRLESCPIPTAMERERFL